MGIRDLWRLGKRPTTALGEVIHEKIINLAGYRQRTGDAWDFYFTSGAWRPLAPDGQYRVAGSF
jgi:hypothetical protein